MTGIVCSMVGVLVKTSVVVAAQVLRSKKGIIAVGNAQIDTAQSQFGGSSALFDGAGDKLVITPNGSFAYSGDFTIEAWVRPASFANAQVLFSQGSAEASMIAVYLESGTGQIIYYAYSNARITSGTNATLNTWQHIAVSRSGSSIRLFRNGTQIGSTYTDTTSIVDATFNIGTWINDTSGWNGHIDEFRVSTTARYTANFVAPTQPFANDDNTVLLIHANGTDATTFFEDDNGSTTLRTAKTLTAVNNAQLSTAQEKFGQSSLLFDGTGDCVTTSTSNDFVLSTNFTIEFQIRFNAVDTLYVPICQRPGVGVANGDWWCEVTAAEDEMYWGFKNTAGTQYYVNLGLAGTAFAINTWYHIALVCNNNVMQLYQNGTAVGGTTSVTGTFGSSSVPVTIGALGNATTYSYSLNGYMDEIRISKVARYAANFTAPTATFANDANTLLLIHADGANASVTVTDDNSGRSPMPVIAFGNAQVSTAQSQFGGTSALFDGTGDYLFSPSSTVFEFGVSDFTLEGWFRFVNFTNGPALFDLRSAGGTEIKPVIYCGSDGTIYYYVNGAARITGSILSANTWYHITVSRASGSTKMFINGTQTGSTYADTNNYPATVVSIGIASWNTAFSALNGYVDEIRISNTARYTAAFTAPTTPFVNDANTLLLVHADGTNGSTVFRDDNGLQGAAPKTLAVNGNAQLSTAQAKFGSSSLLLDGNGDYLTVTNAHDLNFQKNDFTIEAWVRFDVLATSNRHTLISNGVSSFTTGWIKFAAADLGAAYYPQVISYDYSSGGTPMMTSSTAVSNNTWYHLAWVRSGTNHYLYLDGVQVASATNATAQGINVNMNLSGTQIGRYSFDNGTPPSATYMDGYIDEMRISNVARYTAAFAPSSTAFTPDANTLFLSHFEGANASTTIVDSGGRSQKGVQAIGNAQVSTAQSKFGGASSLYDGNGDYLQLANSNDFNFTGNYTIEGWWYQPSNVAAGIYPTLIGTGAVGDNKGWAVTSEPTTNKVLFITSGDGVSGMQVLLTSANLSAATWNHWAIVRSSSVLTVYINGTASGSTYTTTGNSIASTYPLYIGGGVGGLSSGNFSSSSATVVNLNGYQDEIRLSNTARYTANFTPSTTPFQNDDNTVLLLHMDGTNASTVFFDDNGAKPYTP